MQAFWPDKERTMIYEIAEIDTLEGHAEAFEAAVAEANAQFKGARGCHSLRLERSLEHPLRYRLVVGWATVEDHIVHFRESEGFRIWRALAGPHFASPPRVENVTLML